ncbi:hypothetical protein BB28_04955 [Mycobacteroides chelonae CCUG 47445]|nr:hypothetical protein BB28_04955 [Mycobacteroides chelonae CCUG 47445]
MHVEFGWPGGGRLPLGSTTHTDSVRGSMRPTAGNLSTFGTPPGHIAHTAMGPLVKQVEFGRDRLPPG